MMFKKQAFTVLLTVSTPSGIYYIYLKKNLNNCIFPLWFWEVYCFLRFSFLFFFLFFVVWRAGAPKYSDPDIKEDFTQRAIFFFHNAEPSRWIKISIAIVKSNSNDMGPSPWTQKPALKNVIFASHGVGNGNLCPLYCRRGWHKRRKIYSFALGILYDNQRRRRQNSVVPHNNTAIQEGRSAQWRDLYLRIIIFSALSMKCVKTRELPDILWRVNYVIFFPGYFEKVFEIRMKTHALLCWESIFLTPP